MLIYKIGIGMIPMIGPANAKKLIAYCGGVEAVFKEKKKALLKIPGIGTATVNAILSQNVLSEAEKEVCFVQEQGIVPLFYLDKKYPERLKYCNDGPLLLYFKGDCDLNRQKVLAVVGTRKATDYGKEMCESVIRDLSDLGVLIVSGLAYGLDICAHKAALNHQLPTVGVLGHGLDRIYPSLHKNTASKMLENGGLLTEFRSSSPFEKENFPKRNRIIAGMADATLVVEAARKGGALITAEIANSYSRDVFAVPGRSGERYSEGCNYLIKTNRAAMVESAADIIYQMAWEEKEMVNKGAVQTSLFVELSPEEQLLYDLLKGGEMTIDLLALQSELTVSKVAALLLTMEFNGLLKSLPGKVYKLI